MKWYLPVALFGLTSAGCIFVSNTRTASPPPPQVVYVPVPPGATTQAAVAADFKTRIDAASSITSSTQRDEVLAKISKQAAEYGDVAMTRQAIDGISSLTLRNSACETAALALAHRGRRPEAIELARTITSSSQRDQILEKLASQ